MREPLEHRIQRGPLFRDEKNPLPLSHALRDEICNRLTLARARRALDDAVQALPYRDDSPLLGGVSVKDEKVCVARHFIELSRLNINTGLGQLLPRR